jgi:hypothetical protein
MKVTSVIDACCSRTNKNYMTQLATMEGVSVERMRPWTGVVSVCGFVYFTR